MIRRVADTPQPGPEDNPNIPSDDLQQHAARTWLRGEVDWGQDVVACRNRPLSWDYGQSDDTNEFGQSFERTGNESWQGWRRIEPWAAADVCDLTHPGGRGFFRQKARWAFVPAAPTKRP
jgi:hypothetical protein